MANSNNKLHPIYVALESHQYSRAVKLASSLPQSNDLGQALLAHAHFKSGHAVKSLLVIQSVLWFESEQLEWEIHRLGGAGETSVESAPKKGKKGPKQRQETPATTTVPVQRDLLEQLDKQNPLMLAKGWDRVKVNEKKTIISDETTLDTLQITLQSMRLYATVYQMYASASTVAGVTPHVLTKAFTTGLRLVPESLAGMQVFALQLARLRPETTLWAAAAALWQLEWCLELEDAKQQMLPRLAESLAGKCAQDSAEASLLYISTLQYQKKWQQVVNVSKESQQLTTQQRGEREAHALEQLQQYQSARGVYEKLLQENPEQWAYWKKILECAHYSGGHEEACRALESCLQKIPNNNNGRPCRSRHLTSCELASLNIRNDTTTEQEWSELRDAIIQYGSVFAARASCAYSDLAPYIELLLLVVKSQEASESLLEWTSSQLLQQHDRQGEMDRSLLRSYIFAIQVTYKILCTRNNDNLNHKFLPDWTDLVNNWRASQKLGTSKEGEGVQKENQPGDELILLAVQNLLFRKVVDDDATTNLITAASLLEEALVFSPHNTSLRIAAIDVCFQLNAVHRAYELYQGLSIKHIQLDSCSYLISSKLVQGGLYNEAIELCNDVLKFHKSIARDTGEFAATSMEHGTLSKADEFLQFFRTKMQPSLTLLDAKGRIMDCAPLLYTEAGAHEKHTFLLGLHHGIVGGESDLERVAHMVREAHNPLGAPSIMTMMTLDDDESVRSSSSDNRDFSILHHEILSKSCYATKEELLRDSIRRGLLHSLLVRLSLCMEAIKGPKKGKAPKPSELLQKRCTSLMNVVDKISSFLVESGTHDSGHQECMEAILTLVRTIVVISTGKEENEDSLSSREECATQQLESIVIPSITWSIPVVCQFLPDMLVPLVVVIRNTANLFALFGWGKRKARASAGALAKLASDVKDLVGAMREEMSSLPESDDERTAKGNELLGLLVKTKHCLNDSIAQTVCQSVSASQQLTHHRVVPFLNELLDELSSFQVDKV